MKKTLIITLEFPPKIGGIATYVDQLASALDPSAVLVLAPKDGETESFDKSRKYRVMRREFLWPAFVWPRWTRLLLQVWRVARKENIECVILHHVLPVCYVAFVLKKLRRAPYIIFSHGTDVLAASQNKWKTFWLRKMVVDSEQIIFNSESLKTRFLRVLPQLANKSLVLFPCPEASLYASPPEEELRVLRQRLALEGKRVILSVSRLDEGKGFPHLIRMMVDVLNKNPNVVWLIVGTGPKESVILKDIQERSLQNVVRFVGEVSHENLKSYYYLADLFVLLTHPDEGREEGLGLVFLEAAAAGLPVIAGRSGGVEEGVIHARTGLVFDVYTQGKEISEAILHILDNREYAKTLGNQARERMKAEFNWPNQISKLKQWLDK